MNKEQAKDQLLQLYENQIQDLTVMSKIELGDDVIEEIMRLKMIINSQDMPPEYNELISENFWNLVEDEPKIIGKKFNLDLGSLSPVSIIVKDMTKDTVIVEYLDSTPGRIEEFTISDFEYLTRVKIS
jgi:hypothetical protein